MGILSSLNGFAQLASYCRLFYTDTASLPMGLALSWSPWRYPGQNLQAIQNVLPHIEEKPTRELGQAWADQMQNLEDLNEEWKGALARFFDLPIPETEEGYQQLRDRVEAHRREKGPTWIARSEFQPLVLRLDQVITVVQQLQPRLQDVLQSFYARVRPEDLQNLMGDQRAQDLVEASRGEPSPKRAIKQLNRALRQGQTGALASEIYLELGFRYAQLGEIEQAIENYTRSIEAGEQPNPLVHFWRGELYHQQEQWDRALLDLQRAISLGLASPEREQAEEYISELPGR